MPRRGENIYKRKDGRWEARYIKERDVTGKAIYGFIYGKSYLEVKQKVDSLRKKCDIEKKINNKLIFRDVAQQWLSYMSAGTKQSTSVKYRNVLERHILPVLGDAVMQDISASDIEKFSLQKLQNGRLDGKGGLSAKTVNDMLSVIREIFYYAEKRNSCALCRFREVHVKQPERNLQIITKKYQEKLEQYLLMNESLRNIGILMSLYMGLRIGEICALKWKDILFEQGIVQVRHTMQRLQNFCECEEDESKTKVIITAPKSASAVRDIPIPMFLMELLKDHAVYNKDAFFLTGSDRIFVEPRTFQYYFKKVLEENGIPDVNYHVLRHTFATRCIEMGFDMKSLSEILGHSTVNITLNNYIHASMELKRENMLKIAEPISYLQSER